MDWGFIIGYVLSLIALLFTFDSISHEREQGTLRLMFANSIPRHTVLIGKFLGALISIKHSFHACGFGEPLSHFHVERCAPRCRGLGTSMSHFLDYAPVHKSISGVGVARFGTCATERGESRDTPLGLGHLCRFYASTLVSIAGRSTPPKTALGFSERSAQLEEEIAREYYTLRYGSDKSFNPNPSITSGRRVTLPKTQHSRNVCMKNA